ncbi:MAG: hypothetical protein ACI9EF_001572, partial [Pseudohongiellaceae bacterium]
MTHIGEARWQQFILDECDSEARLVIEAHLAECSECRQRLAQERQLDEWLLESLPAAVPGASHRSLERLWETLDQEGDDNETHPAFPEHRPDELAHKKTASPEMPARTASGTGWRQVALWWPAAAAATVFIVVSLFGNELSLPPGLNQDSLVQRQPKSPSTGLSTRAPLAEEQSAASSPESLAATLPSDEQPLDLVRLRQAQQRMAGVLLDASEREAARPLGPQRAGVFNQACSSGFASLRREGWPVGSLLRGWALGDDGELAQLALRYAAHEPATWNVLGTALAGEPQRSAAVIDLLIQDIAPLESSVTLVRALERLAVAGLRGGSAANSQQSWRCAELLSRSPGLRPRAAFARLLEQATHVALADLSSAAAGEQLLRLVAFAPTPEALATLLAV